MADYSSQEINTAVTSLVQSGVSTPLDTLGTRRTDIAFSQVQQAVAGVFILYPLAPYYCLYLGAQQVLQAVASEAATIASILEAIESLNRYVLPVTDLSPLYNAQSALQALQGAVATTAPSDITKLAQYQRFASNVNAFLAGPGGQAVKQNGAIVPTPAEAQASLPGLITTLQQQHTALVTSITQLANGITSYQSVNLPSLVAAGVITNASSVLASDTATLAALTPAARTAALRTPILNLITSMAAVTTMGSSGNTSEFYNVPGPGTTYSDSLHLATPASLDGNLGPPYNIQTGVNDQLTLTMDGAAPFSVTVPGALGAQIQGTVVEQPSSEASPGASPDGFLISDGTNPHPIYVNGNPANGTVPTPAANNQLQFMAVGSIDSYDVVVLLTTSVVSGDNVIRRTAQEICDDINAELATRSITGIVAEPYFYPTAHFNGAMNIVPTTGPTAEFYPYVAGASSLTPVQVGDILVILTGPDADIWDVTAVSPTFVTANARVVTPVAASDVATEIGPKDRAIGLYVVDPALIGQGMYLQILGSNVTFTNGANTIGWPVNSIFNSTLRVPYDIYTAINQQTTEVTAASTLLDPISLPLTTDPVNPFHVVISKVFEVGSLVYTPGSPNSISLTGFTGLEAGGVLVGDTLVLRGQNNTAWTVTAFTDTTVTATSSVNTATTTPSATFEIGSTLPTIVDWYTVVVDSGPNSGSYVVSSFGVSPLDLIFQQRWTIPHYADQTTLEPITMTGSIGIEVLTLTSENTTVSSSVLVSPSCTALPFFWSSPPAISYGSTPYLLIPTPTGGAVPQPGDIVTFYQTNYGVPSQTCTVETVDPSVTGTGYILGLSPEIQDLYGSTPSNSWPFPPNQIPYATLMHGHMVDFAVFQTACTTWLAQVPNQPAYFQTIDRLMNPITSSTNPTMANVNAAIAGIKALADLLDIADNEADLSSAVPIEMVLDDYVVVDMPQIDTLIQTYKQKGADLALDTLTSGQFATFFGLTEQQSSYAGAMQGAMTAVAQNDLPVRKGNRPDSLSSRLLGNAPSDDPEFNTEDSDTGLKPDATSDFQKD